MKSHKAILMFAMVLALTAGAAYAETVQGEVINVDLEGKSIEVEKSDAAGVKETVKITVNDTTTYSGEVTALEEMIEGDVVKLEADKDPATGAWVAKSVDVSVAE
jgi:glycine cleavage system H lipoate-binding protein